MNIRHDMILRQSQVESQNAEQLSAPLTLEQAKQWFEDRGLTVTEWATRFGFRRDVVYGVLNGRLKGRWGEAHEIAVTLRLKQSPGTNAEKIPTYPPAGDAPDNQEKVVT